MHLSDEGLNENRRLKYLWIDTVHQDIFGTYKLVNEEITKQIIQGKSSPFDKCF